MRLIDFWWSHGPELAALSARHALLVAVSTVAAIIVGVPLGIAAAHRPRVGGPR